jgi:tetratricopeptide (TPR) repeat protein
MKIPPRIIAPILCAVLCGGLLIAILWWQLLQSTAILSQKKPHTTSSIINQEDMIAPLSDNLPLDTHDEALMHLRKGDLLSIQGEWKEAEKEYTQAVDKKGGLPALRRLAQAQLQRRNIRGMKSTLSQMKREGARGEDILLLESIVLMRTGEMVRAKKLLEGSKDSPQKNYGLALIAILEGFHELAQERLQDVINGWEPIMRSYAQTLQAAYDEFELFPQSPNIHLITLLARSLAQVQECELALPLLVQVTSQQDDYRDAWIVQGYCEFVTERPEQALHSFERAYALDPEKPEVQYFLGRTYAKLGNSNTSITFLKYALTNGFEPANDIRRLIAEQALASGDEIIMLENSEYFDHPIPTGTGSTKNEEETKTE